MSFPANPHAPPAPHRDAAAAWCARRASRATTSCSRCFVVEGSRRARAGRVDAGRAPLLGGSARARGQGGAPTSGVPAVILFGIPAQKDARGSGADAADGVVQRAVAALKRRGAGPRRDHRRVPVRVHGPRPLRDRGGRRRRERPLGRASRCGGALPRARRRRHRRALRHDGRARRRDPQRARRARLRGRRDPLLCRQVRERLLRAVPRGGRERAGVRRPALLPDGPAQPPRGAPRDARSTSRRAPTC